MHTRITTNLFAALLLAVAASLANAADLHNLRQDRQLLANARAASGNAADPAFRATLGLSSDDRLEIIRSYNNGLGGTVTRYRQTHRGIPVWGEQIVIGRDAAGRVKSLHGRMVRDLAAELHQLRPVLSSDEALLAMKAQVRKNLFGNGKVVFDNEQSELVIYLDNGVPRLGQAVSFFADSESGGQPTRPTFIVDALSGEVLLEYEGLTHADCGSDCLNNGVAATNLSGKTRSWQYFEFTVPADGSLEISISGGSGDADLYVRKGQDPTRNNYTCRPYLAGNEEQCSLPAVNGEVWRIGIYAYRSYSGVDLLAEVTNPTHVDGSGPGGNLKTRQYTYGTEFGYLDVVKDDNTTCTMNNVNVKTVDLNHGTSGSTAYEYVCPENLRKEINGAFSPLNDAHYFGGVVFDMYQDYLGESPLTFQLTMRVHYSSNYENAFWDGSSMTFGDGANTFYPLVSLDVSAHEVSHGFTEQNSNLTYSGQSGGINEAFSDIAGEAAEFYMRGDNDFLVGADIFKADGALRDMCDPTLDGKSIGHVGAYYSGLDVHYSSGVFNKAFCELAKTTGWNVEKAFKAFALANQLYWTPSANFVEGAQGVVDAADDLGFSAQDVADAFAVVGITGLVLPGDNTPPTASFTFDCTDLECTFDASSSADSDGSIVSYAWDYGDGNTGSGQTPTHTYTAGGTYTVKLTVTDDGGKTANAEQAVTVSSGDSPEELLTSTTNEGSTWTATVYTQLDNPPLSGNWHYLDGNTASCSASGNNACTLSGIKKKQSSVEFTSDGGVTVTVFKP